MGDLDKKDSKAEIRYSVTVVEIMAEKEKDVRKKLALEMLIRASKEYAK